MLESLLGALTIHQKTRSKVVSFDVHLHCCSPLHSTAHRQNQMITGLSKELQPLCWVRGSLVPQCHPLLNVGSITGVLTSP